MREHEWAALEVGDPVRYVGGTDRSAHHSYRVMQIKDGQVFVTRLVSQRQHGTGQATVSETIVIRDNSDDWAYERVRPKISLAGGFTVRRADGTEEYEACPTPTTPRQPRNQGGA